MVQLILPKMIIIMTIGLAGAIIPFSYALLPSLHLHFTSSHGTSLSSGTGIGG